MTLCAAEVVEWLGVLNCGDGFANALAKSLGAGLLFVGEGKEDSSCVNKKKKKTLYQET